MTTTTSTTAQILANARAMASKADTLSDAIGQAKSEADAILEASRARLEASMGETKAMFATHQSTLASMLEGFGADLSSLLEHTDATDGSESVRIAMAANAAVSTDTTTDEGGEGAPLPSLESAKKMGRERLMKLAARRGISLPGNASPAEIREALGYTDSE